MQLSFFLSSLLFSMHKTIADEFEVQLYRHLMRDYNKAIRPSLNYTMATDVTLSFSLHQLIDLIWSDYRLSWDPAEHGGITQLHIPAERIWRPDVILINGADPENKNIVLSTDVFITDDGSVTWLAFAIFQSSCQINVRFYPFDEQECVMIFSSWTNDGTKINLTTTSDSGDISNFIKNGEWQLQSVKIQRQVVYYSCCEDVPWPVVNINIHIRRQPLFYVFNHILPCLIITSMALLGFCIPADTGEKISMCITTMLSMGIFLKNINENMPPTGDHLPLIGMYYTASLLIVCFGTIINVLILNVHHRGGRLHPERVPAWVKQIFLKSFAKLLFVTGPDADIQEYLSLKNERDAELSSRELRGNMVSAIVRSVNFIKFPFGKGSSANSKTSPAVAETEKVKTSAPAEEPPTALCPKSNTIFGDSEGIWHRKSEYLASRTPRNDKKYNTPKQKVSEQFEETFYSVLNQVYKTLEQSERRIDAEDYRTIAMWEWKKLATVIDRLLLLLFVATTASTSFVMLVQPAMSTSLIDRTGTTGLH